MSIHATSAVPTPEDAAYRLGRHLAERGDELLRAALDPAHLLLFLGGLVLFGAAATGAARLAARALYAAAELLDGGRSVVLGDRREGALDALVWPPVRQRLEDFAFHNQVLGPTGQGKTTLLEWIVHRLLKLGVTVFVHETTGDLSRRVIPRARAMGRPVHVFDPGNPNSLKWNPLAGDPEKAAERALATLTSVSSSSEAFYRTLNQVVLRRLIYAAAAYSVEVLDREPTLAQIREFLRNPRELEYALEVRWIGEKGREPSVGAPWLDRETRLLFQDVFFRWNVEERARYTLSLFDDLEMVLGRACVEEALTPAPGEPTLDLSRALDAGGLVVMRADPDACGETSSGYLSVWMVQHFQGVAEGRDESSRPVAAFFDELHESLGHRDAFAQESFARFFTRARHSNVWLTVSYQALRLLGDTLRETLAGNAGNKFVSGRLSVADAAEAQEMAGYEERSEPLGEHRRSGGHHARRSSRRPRYPADEIRRIPRGLWLYIGTRAGDLRRPTLFQARQAPPLPRRPEPARAGSGAEEPRPARNGTQPPEGGVDPLPTARARRRG